MNSSGFYNDGKLSILYADNVNFSGTYVAEILQNGQLLIGASTYPYIRPGNLRSDHWINITNSPGSITASLKYPPVIICRNYVFTKEIFKIFTAMDAEHLNWSLYPKILSLTIQPKEPISSFLITGNIMASRREGVFCTFISMNTVNNPIAFSTGYSLGYPVNCPVSIEYKPLSMTPFTVMLFAAPLTSGTLVLNGSANGGNFLGIPNSLQSSLSVLELYGGA
ncbi:virulence factor Pgp3 [Candidatus Clavichlamydia salmonicola]|uniref:virulence factor Pgp3 n=1 Tax=Candidatus Clavichlamydia salmonicola TaxID=469812 RepID=UPI001890EB92|nr:virulence factor Pgp3 [Candidatus Clavichlamydia salmonicola]